MVDLKRPNHGENIIYCTWKIQIGKKKNETIFSFKFG